MRMLYKILKPAVLSATHNFFSQVIYRGTPVEEGPLLIVANHPNVVLDGLLVIGSFRREVWFTVKGSIFRGLWINWLLRWLHFIPVHRRQDDPERMSENAGTFKDVSLRLKQNLAVLIFPEGDSLAERRLQRLKTGAARIALQAEVDNGFKLGLKIQPVGITYSDFFRFNSSVTVVAGRPILTGQYQSLYERDAEAAVQQLTTEVEDRLRELIVEFHYFDDASLVEMLHKLYQSRGYGWDDQSRLERVRKQARILKDCDTSAVASLRRRLVHYLEMANALKLTGEEDLQARRSRIFMSLVAPFILIGIILLFIPFKLSYFISQHMSRRSSQRSSWALSVAFFIFPLWNLLVAGCVFLGTKSVGWALAAIFVVVSSGYFTSKYFNRFAIYVFTMLWPGKKTPVDVLGSMRDELVAEIEQLSGDGFQGSSA